MKIPGVQLIDDHAWNFFMGFNAKLGWISAEEMD
jgi:hypothetical protein